MMRLEATDIIFSLEGKRVIDQVSLALMSGEVVTIGGASGSGKTSFLRILARLTQPDTGHLYLNGVSGTQLSPREYRRKVAFVLQESPMFEGTVAENVAQGPRLLQHILSSAALDKLLESVGLVGFGPRTARDLSGGERQRVALARALANEPEVLLLDEPTSALDGASAERVCSLVQSLAKTGLAVVMVTHSEAVLRVGRGLWLEAGRLHVRAA